MADSGIVSGIGVKLATEAAKAIAGKVIQVVAGHIRSPSDRFLNYDPGFLRETYRDEEPIGEKKTIPYTEICDFSTLARDDAKVTLSVEEGEFRTATGDDEWRSVSSQGYHALKESERIGENELAIRVSKANFKTKPFSLTIQRARYDQQAYSNLILDFEPKSPKRVKLPIRSLREQLRNKYKSDLLPPLDDPCMANTLGVACLLFYREEGDKWIPYLVKRVRDIAVFPGGVHCTASGVAQWPKKPVIETLEDFVTPHMLSELTEEVGLIKDDLEDFRPVSLCREMVRGGKPQLFYSGFIKKKLDRDALQKLRKKAARSVKPDDQWPEVERDRFLRPADVLPEEGNKYTLECEASLFVARRYAKLKYPKRVIG